MIDGITILNNVTVSNFNPLTWLGVLSGFLILIIIYIAVNSNNVKGAICWACVISTVLFTFLIIDIHFSKVDAIQCTIDDDISINEVYDKYDVIDKQGEIWTLKEKNR